jgi:hypothetical protein
MSIQQIKIFYRQMSNQSKNLKCNCSIPPPNNHNCYPFWILLFLSAYSFDKKLYLE